MRSLAELLPGPIPNGIVALPAERQAELATLLAQTRRAQAQELEAAAYSLLDLVPSFLRGVVRRAAGL